MASIDPQTLRSIDQAKSEVESMIENGLSSSAEVLCSFLISNSRSQFYECAILELQADCIFARKEFKRALNLYRQILRMRVSLSGGHVGNRRSISIETEDEARIKFKEFECMIALEETTGALSELESIPAKLRTTKMNTAMSKLYISRFIQI